MPYAAEVTVPGSLPAGLIDCDRAVAVPDVEGRIREVGNGGKQDPRDELAGSRIILFDFPIQLLVASRIGRKHDIVSGIALDISAICHGRKPGKRSAHQHGEIRLVRVWDLTVKHCQGSEKGERPGASGRAAAAKRDSIR